MNNNLWEILSNEFIKYPMLRGKPISESEITTAEERLKVVFSKDYREFILKYGGGIVGYLPIIGLSCAEAMDIYDSSVVDVTERFRSDKWKGIDSNYVISIGQSGNPIFMDENGKIWESDHDSGEVVFIAESFELFIEHLLNY